MSHSVSCVPIWGKVVRGPTPIWLVISEWSKSETVPARQLERLAWNDSNNTTGGQFCCHTHYEPFYFGLIPHAILYEISDKNGPSKLAYMFPQLLDLWEYDARAKVNCSGKAFDSLLNQRCASWNKRHLFPSPSSSCLTPDMGTEQWAIQLYRAESGK